LTPGVTRANRAIWISTAIVAGVGVTIVMHATQHGVGTFGDSGAYFGMAENFRHGRGLTLPYDLATDRFSPFQTWKFHGAVPSTHFPPGYPLALTLFAPPGVSLWTGARLLAFVLTFANLMLSARIAHRLLPDERKWYSLAVPALLIGIMGRPLGFLLLHATMSSEGLFFTCALTAILLMLRYFEHPSLRLLVGMSSACGAALLTRHVGLSLLPVLSGVVLLTNSGAWKSRIIRLMTAVPGAAAPWIAYLLYGRALGGGAAGSGLREFASHPLEGTREQLQQVISSWFVSAHISDTPRFMVAGLMTIGVVVMTVWGARSGRIELRGIALLAGFVLAYLSVVVFSRTYIDAAIPIDDRLLSPLRPMFVVLFVVALAVATARLSLRPAALLIAAVVLVMVAPRWSDQRDMIRIYARPTDPHPFSELDAIRTSPVNTLIVSSAADVITTELQRPAIMTAKKRLEVLASANRCFTRDVKEDAELLNYYGGFVYFSTASLQFGNTVSALELSHYTEIREVARSSSGVLYRVVRNQPALKPAALRC
jgi:hypothetical protein